MASQVQGVVYLLHYERPIVPGRPAQHYMGWASRLEARLEHHRNGTGARLPQVAALAGVEFELVRTWQGSRALERRLKRWKKHRRFCPICRNGADR